MRSQRSAGMRSRRNDWSFLRSWSVGCKVSDDVVMVRLWREDLALGRTKSEAVECGFGRCLFADAAGAGLGVRVSRVGADVAVVLGRRSLVDVGRLRPSSPVFGARQIKADVIALRRGGIRPLWSISAKLGWSGAVAGA